HHLACLRGGRGETTYVVIVRLRGGGVTRKIIPCLVESDLTQPVEHERIPGVRRLPVRTPTLPPATHTNVYLVGQGEIAVVDPASPYPEERAALDRFIDELAGAGERVVEILLTHHHVD